tara:strand:+ start:1347 stop:2048 length:702 start_codon:yes stop_codon:yes gene_type:complete
MATFVKGNWVEICPYPDYRWEHWSVEHTNLCGKRGQITEVSTDKWTNSTFIEVDHRNQRLWFLPDHLIKVENYNIVFDEAVQEACERLQHHESVCKRLRDEILEGVFGEDKPEEELKKELKEEVVEEELYDDWQEITTKEVIPLPGNGGTMTDPSDSPKSKANSHRKKVRTKRGKVASKAKSKKKPISDDWTISEEELEELQNYVDNLPYQQTTTDDDYEYFYGDDDDSDWFT